MERIRVCIIGAGNISNTRHIPSLLMNEEVFEIKGVISDQKSKLDRTKEKYNFIPNSLLIDINDDIELQLSKCEWFKEIDAAIIGTPPKQHFSMTLACLKLRKHVLVEKPMMMDVNQCEEVQKLAKNNHVVLYVMHSFQFSNGMMRLVKLHKGGKLGKLQSILELQLSNRDRRLPAWYNDLPLGLFYDEAAHFFYGARRFGGKLKVLNAHAQYNKEKENTPRFLEVQMHAGDIPVQMYMNFNSPICEWGLILICDKKIAIYDYFKDILIILDNDHEHYAMDVLKTSIAFSSQFWFGFLKNGFKMVSGKLLYGHNECVKRWGRAILNQKTCFELSAGLGREVVEAMNEVVRLVDEQEEKNGKI